MYDKSIEPAPDSRYYKYKKEEHAEMWKTRYEFIAIELVLEVLKTMRKPKTWKQVGLLAVHEYDRQALAFQDSAMWGLLFDKGDDWIKPTRISSSLGKKRISQLLQANGFYVSRPPGQGIKLTTDPKLVEEDHGREVSGIKTRAKNVSKVAQMATKTIPGVNLGVIETTVYLPKGD
jgi:hypothetical protein